MTEKNSKNSIQWEHIHHIHFVGIKGVAMTALAVWAKEKGIAISGSDIAEEFPTDEVLRRAGISVLTGFSTAHVQGDIVVYTGAHGGRENPEVVEAIRKNIPAFPHGIALGQAMRDFQQISVAGCHGKTTTTAMIATILKYAGLDPSYCVGSGEVRGLGLPGHFGSGQFFVAEADEYVTDPKHDSTPRFMWQKPEIAVVTTIDYDHPDVYRDLDDVGHAYAAFIDQLDDKRMLIFNGNNTNNSTYLSNKRPALTYGTKSSDLIVHIGEQHPLSNSGEFVFKGEKVHVTLKIPGTHNLLNAAAAFLVAKELKIDTQRIVEGLYQFGGASRRFEYLSQKGGTIFIDDYAHHPAEIKATLNAARQWYPSKHIIAIFQPHTYSRTKTLLAEFASAFSDADEVGILPIYASARETVQVIDTAEVVTAMRTYHKHVRSYSSLELFFQGYSQETNRDDVVLFLGAGDIGRNARTYLSSSYV